MSDRTRGNGNRNVKRRKKKGGNKVVRNVIIGLEALELVKKKINSYNFALVVIGHIDKEIQVDASFPVFCTGLVKSQIELAKIYSSVNPTIKF